MTAIEKVAEHINEMQRITEQFSPVFHQLIEEFGVFEVNYKSRLPWANRKKSKQDTRLLAMDDHGRIFSYLDGKKYPRLGEVGARIPDSVRAHQTRSRANRKKQTIAVHIVFSGLNIVVKW